MALSGILVDVGAASLLFAAAGVLIVVTALAGVVWGVPSHMREA
jgi:hypothetical protein